MSKASDDFPEPGEAGEDDQAVAGEVEVDAAEVVLAGTADDQPAGRGSGGHRRVADYTGVTPAWGERAFVQAGREAVDDDVPGGRSDHVSWHRVPPVHVEGQSLGPHDHDAVDARVLGHGEGDVEVVDTDSHPRRSSFHSACGIDRIGVIANGACWSRTASEISS